MLRKYLRPENIVRKKEDGRKKSISLFKKNFSRIFVEIFS
jgi:hypothetical protein